MSVILPLSSGQVWPSPQRSPEDILCDQLHHQNERDSLQSGLNSVVQRRIKYLILTGLPASHASLLRVHQATPKSTVSITKKNLKQRLHEKTFYRLMLKLVTIIFAPSTLTFLYNLFTTI